MKKGKKLLAAFLAVVMVATSFVWDFGKVQAEDTTESTSAITQRDDGVSIDFDNIDVAELDANGYTSTKFLGGEAVQGEVNQAASKHWFSGDGNDTPYGNGGTIKSKNVGLKTKDTEADNTRTVMYTPYSYEDFQISAEIYYGAYSGIVLGEKNVYPDGVTSPSVALFFNSGRIHIVGAVERSTAKIMRGTSAAIADNGSALGYKIFNNGAGDTIKANAGGTYTVNVKKTGNHLLVWISGGAGLMTIELSDSYKTGWLGIQSRCYDGDGGGFKSLNIEKVHAVEHHDLDNAVMSELNDMGYTSSFGATVKQNSVADAFFSGKANAAGTLTSKNDGLKGITTGTSVSGLNIPYIYENFRLEAEVYHGQLIGVAVGDASSYPRSSDNKMISAFFNIHSNNVMFQWEGAYQGTATRVGGSSGAAANQYKPTVSSGGNKITGTKETVHTIVLEVRDGVMTLWLKGYDGYITAKVADTYTTGKITLMARHSSNDGGGLKSYTITNLDAGDSADFDNVYLQNLDAAGYTASDSADTTLTDKAVSNVWFSGQSGYSSSEANKNNGLKPSDTDSSIDLLNLPEIYDNFRLETTMYHGQVVGVAIGKKGVKPTASSGGDNGLITIYTNSKYIELTGSINKSSANLTAGGEVTNNSNLYHYVPVGFSANWNQERTLVVELQNNILSVWVEGCDGVLRVRVTDAYAMENIALIARRHNTSGNPGGGLKGYTIEKLPATNNINTTVDVAGYTDFDFVDTAVLDEKGFSVSEYETDGAKIVTGESVATHMYAGEVGLSSAGKVAYNKEYPNSGLKTKCLVADNKMTVLNTPYTYDGFRASTEVYWGANTGILIGEENVYPTVSGKTAVRIYFNANQLQLSGGGFDWDTAKTSGGANKWNPHNITTYELGIFKPASDFTASKGAIYKLNVEFVNGIFTIWVDGYDGVVTIKATDEFMDVENKKIALTSRGYDGDCGGLKSLMVEELSDVIIPYTAEEFATYRSADGHTAPTYKNYLFAGWYTEPTCSQLEDAVLSSATTVEEETVYAKFVVRDILTVKAQVSVELLDNNLKNDSTGKIRFATTVDTTNYSQVGFKISYDKEGSGTPKEQVSANKTVYSTLNAIGDVTYQPTDFSKASTYFKACTIKNVGDSYYDLDFTVVPFWKTLDGTVVEGDTVVKTINQGINAGFLDGKTALFIGDSIQNGDNFAAETTEPHAWHERLTRYGMITEEVAQKGWALTNEETSGRSQIATQLDYATKDSYDFVILEGGVNDVRIDQDKQDPDITINWGTIDEDPNKTDYGDSTIAGAMQNLIKATQAKFPNAEIVYIINHYFGANATNMKNYVAMVKAACRVHGISYVDLSDIEAYPTLEPLTKQSAAYIPDNLHPNAAGYELSTPVIANHLRKLVNGELVDTVYVSDNGTDGKGYGTADEPYQTLNYAIEAVEDGGTVYVTDTCTVTNATAWKAHGKAITISGTKADSASVLQAAAEMPRFCIEDAATFTNLTFRLLSTSANSVHAEGNAVTIEEDVIVSGVKEIYGGSRYDVVESTNLKLYAGTYQKIFAGSFDKKVTGDTHVTVGGKVNQGISESSEWRNHTHVYKVYGGGDTGIVEGNTYVTVEEGAEFIYVFGGGRSAASKVLGSTNVVFSGKAMGVNGGAYKGQCNDTNVQMIGGEADQIFGGSEFASISGSANVELFGGKITRRVWGGCYNDSKSTTYSANGTVTVTISPAANLSSIWHGLAATSRYNVTSSSTETGVFIFNDYVNNGTNIKEISASSEGDKTHDHLVKVDANGTAKVVDGKLVVIPNSGYTIASVTGATDNGDGTYTLTNAEVVVTFATAN